MSFAAINLNRSFKNDNAWGYDYLVAYSGGLEDFGVTANSHDAAREFADFGTYLPDGTLYSLGLADESSVDDTQDLMITAPVDINDDGIPDPYAFDLSGGVVPYTDTDASIRLEPGTSEFKNALETVIKTKNFATGAGFITESKIHDIDGYYEFEEKLGFDNILLGGSYKMYRPITNGTIFSDSDDIVNSNGEIEVDEYAFFTQFSKSVWIISKFKLS